jgi:NCS1 family nucleobase:cation symporter-1
MAIILRIILGIVGFAVQSYLGGLCVTALLSGMFGSFNSMPNHFPLSAHITTAQLVGWIVFNVVTIPLIYIRPEKAGRPMMIMNTITIITLLSILIWSLNEAGGAGPLLSQPAKLQSNSQIGWAVVGGVMNVIGSIAPGLCKVP